MEDNEIANEAWEQAVKHAETAEMLRSDLARLTVKVEKSISEQQTLAAFFLAAGGYSDDEAAHQTLNLPFQSE